MRHDVSTNRGFTLLEILIAMAVFAVMAAMAYAGLGAVLDTRAATEQRSERIAQLQQTLYLMNEDLAQALPRPVRDEFGAEQPAFSGGGAETILTLTRSVPEWSALSSRSQLQRVSYRLESGGLYRQVWTVLDRTQQSRFRRRKLIDVVGLDLRFYGEEWRQHWPVSEAGLPRAVEANFNLAGLGLVQRLFLVKQ